MKTSVSTLTTKNLATLAERAIVTSSKPEYDALVKTNPLFTAIKEEYAVYDEVYVKQTFSGMGVEVADADERRDLPFRGSRSILEGYMLVDGFSRQQDAKALYAVIELVGQDLNRLSYSEETASMKKLIEEWDKPDNAERITQLNLTEIVEMMKDGQQQFEMIFAGQTQANAALRQKQSASSIRNELEVALRNYLNMVKAMRNVDAWKGLYTELNELVKAAENSTVTPRVVLPQPPASQS